MKMPTSMYQIFIINLKMPELKVTFWHEFKSQYFAIVLKRHLLSTNFTLTVSNRSTAVG